MAKFDIQLRNSSLTESQVIRMLTASRNDSKLSDKYRSVTTYQTSYSKGTYIRVSAGPINAEITLEQSVSPSGLIDILNTTGIGLFSLDASSESDGNVIDCITYLSALEIEIVNSDTDPPTVPTGLVAGGETQTTIDLSWNASTDNIGVAGYRIYKDSVLETTVTGLNTTITGLTPGTTYAFTVSAFDAAGNESAQSPGVNGTTTSSVWVSQTSGVATLLTSIFFLDDNNGYVVGYSDTYLKTSNGGTTWSDQGGISSGRSWESIFVSDANNIQVSGNDSGIGEIYYSTDGSTFNFSSLSGIGNDNIVELKMLSPSTGFSCGGYSGGGKAARTTDGNSWQDMEMQVPPLDPDDLGFPYNSLHIISSSIVVIVGETGRIRRSTNADAGSVFSVLFSVITSGTVENLNGVDFVDSNNGIIVGDNGTILKSTDAGASWSAISSPTSENINSVSYGDPDNVWACCDNGVIIKSTDGGSTWSIDDTLAGTPNLVSIFMRSSILGFVSGASGTIYVYS